jgi:hypothetical protein
MFWVWSIPDYYPNKRIGEYIEGTGTDRFVFRRSKFIKEEVIPPKIIFECVEKYLSDVLPKKGKEINPLPE